MNEVEDGWERIVGERAHATFLRAVHSRRQLYEVMVEFWTNHFNVNLDDTGADHMITVDNRQVARAHALGRFVDLLQASAHSPAMLIYLNNAISDANSDEGVNENYGRELLELHSMGIIDGVQPYTEADMRGVALTLSGWSVNTDDGQHRFQFKSEMHHAGPVSILGGAFVTPGHTGTAGLADGVTLINTVARHPATARYIAYKLCRRFVADTPPPALVASAAAVYTQHDTAIAPVLRHIFHSSAFASGPHNKVRRGFEVFVAYARAMGGTTSPDPVGGLANHVHGYGWGFLERLGQRLWGHRPPDGYPDTAPDWISADGLLRRWETAGALTATWLDGWAFDAHAILEPTGPTVGTWIEGVARRLLGVVTGYPDHGYRDVPAWAEDSVRWITAKRYGAGWPDRTYRPNANSTRGQVTTMLWKIAGSPTGRPAHGLSDVPARLERRRAVGQGGQHRGPVREQDVPTQPEHVPLPGRDRRLAHGGQPDRVPRPRTGRRAHRARQRGAMGGRLRLHGGLPGRHLPAERPHHPGAGDPDAVSHPRRHPAVADLVGESGLSGPLHRCARRRRRPRPRLARRLEGPRPHDPDAHAPTVPEEIGHDDPARRAVPPPLPGRRRCLRGRSARPALALAPVRVRHPWSTGHG